MAAIEFGSDEIEGNNNDASSTVDRIKQLYPAVNEEETPLPRSWSSKDKYNFIGLSQNNLRVHYKGVGKTHKDAASVRATHPIPASCGLYYFEVKIISKGRDGYMGIGLSSNGVNMNRLPGWDKNSFGYHGDDGHSFCSSGTGQPYGPTFTTGDVIGCGLNLINHTCFYTKNGKNLGVAFTDLPDNLYPTVGLQTPGEVVDANFGQQPFLYDIEDSLKEIQMMTRATISTFPVEADNVGQWETTLQRIVTSYLVHHGYCSTAEAFARSTNQAFEEELTSIKNRQRIQKLVLDGRLGEAIDTTRSLYPGLLERNTNLLFILKVRQFIEMVNGTDTEVRGLGLRSPKSRHTSGSPAPASPGRCAPKHHGAANSGDPHLPGGSGVARSPPPPAADPTGEMNSLNAAASLNGRGRPLDSDGEEMEVCHPAGDARLISNGVTTNGSTSGLCMNGDSPHPAIDSDTDDMDMELGSCSLGRQLCGGNLMAVEKMLQFGRELQKLSILLQQESATDDKSRASIQKTLQDAFSLLAYSDPWSSPVGYQLDPVQREPICDALNSVILGSYNLPRHPPLELAIGHTTQCLKLMSKVGLGSSAFANIESYLH